MEVSHMTDTWIARLYVLGEIVMFVTTGVLIALGHDSVITDLFCVAGGGLTGHSLLSKVGKTTTPSD
jgi:hypothetical protein